MSSSKRPIRKPSAKTGPPASARLTIKPMAASGRPRSVTLPPRPRPGGARRLSEVVLEEDEILAEGFEAVLAGNRVRITAVLERTCVYLGTEGERRLASKKDLWVEADKLPIRRRGYG
ncbi:MAG TPA: hypothetical protein VKT20_09815 [Candidatus Dormibacteraeota bacterium]|nr:hypothetical protein [Candidatus Dormibacteraeota bacterium]